MVKRAKPPVTIEMVAAEAGVSKTTVSFVLNNNPTISETTRARVLKITKELGYQPNVNARNLSSSRRSRAICVLVPEIGHIFEDAYFSRALGGIYDELEAADYRLVLRKASFEFAKEKEYLNLFRRAEVSGMLYVGSTMDDHYLKDFADTNFPFVFVNSSLPGVALPSVKADNFGAGYELTRHLIGLGHRRIAHIAGSLNTSSASERYEGYKKALEEAGIELDEDLVAYGHFNRRDAAAAALRLWEAEARPTAIYVGNDNMALGVLEAFEKLEIKIPSDIAIVGTDNIELSEFTRPPLTTAETTTFEVAREAVRLLMDIMDGRIENPAEQRIVPTQVILRQSCGAALTRTVKA